MNANKTTIAASAMVVAVTALTTAFPASADDHRDFRRGERVFVHRPAPVYYPEPVYAYAPAPAYYEQRGGYRDDDSNPTGAVAGAVIGGVIGSQVGDRDSRGVTTVIGAILGGLIGNGL